ncbi:Ig-like domain-containing protein [Clostridium saccharobutylicum]|uniref:Bacterial surface protein n=1 Tax=Clostridium saccharobutylicum DSM 13864 TaxID=1345695 RepID=U5MT60_CLOSA|nr:Ig-like domain-containing protein [Clostridium saccharobutylicum]AGX43939.1 bacterial surface protein [Clostridium saccharobutylicum DSM 13864]AQR91237.1 bacterial Ig-like domain protein [Clostridium saccharobutylicum]AQS01141.1 bacterial Ig-like domain protein [Clostridium saccharobutylicum]AQS15124.1 bacterial Ig-like domain protein [Clostridium saccharobutylicum]MBA2905250.1 uncharacterized protein YjdB [Clostridium saccharobutylicum]
MKNYFKKFSIMFVMLLAVIGVGIIQDGSVANAATLGQQLTSPEAGWQRIDDTDSRIKYDESYVISQSSTMNYNYTEHNSSVLNNKMSFKFFGTKLRLINRIHPNRSIKVQVKIDGVVNGNNDVYSISDTANTVTFEVMGLESNLHTVEIENLASGYMVFDALDIDATGYLVNPNTPISTITLNQSSINLNIGDSQQLTATTTPASVGVKWTSSDSSIATVDPTTGKVTGVKEGQVKITAITADGLTATCIVTVTKKDDPQPSNPGGGTTTGDANLYIELVDGQIKQYSVSQDEINKFTTWFENRDKDHSLSATYKLAKGTYTDYVVHDQIDWFEVR